MLRRNDDRIYADRFPVLVVLDRDLAFAVRTQIGQDFFLADFGELPRQAMRQICRHWHIGGRFIAGVAEHHPLISGTLLSFVRIPGFQGLIHAHSDIRRLLVYAGDNAAGSPVESVIGGVKADLQNCLAGDLWNVHIRLRGYFTHNQNQTCIYRSFTGDPRLRVLLQDSVQNGVGNLIAYLIRMSFRD